MDSILGWEPHYMRVPFIVVQDVRWLLTTSAGMPERRIAGVDALTRAIDRHLAECDHPTFHKPLKGH